MATARGGRRRAGDILAALVLLVLATGAVADKTILVTTNKDLVQADGDENLSLREAINLANAEPAGTGQVTITFNTGENPAADTVFTPNPTAPWTATDVNYDGVNDDPNRIEVGSAELTVYGAAWPADASGTQPLPLPAITRSNVRIDGDMDDNGVPDVRISLGDLMYVWAHMFGVARSWGIQVAAPSSVLLEGLDIRFGMPHPFNVRDSVPAVWFTAGTLHRIRGCTVQANVIGIETSVAAGNEIFVGATSAGGRCTLSGNQFAGLYIRGGTGRVTVQSNTISGNGNATDTVSGGILIESNGDNLIGGTVASAGNTVSGNFQGIVIAGAGNNTIQANAISASQGSGVRVTGSGNNTVGGTVNGAANTITGNGTAGGALNHAGVYIDPNGNGDNRIQGNSITSNRGAGVHIEGDGDNLVGGPDTLARNVISSNGTLATAESGAGVEIRGDGANDGNNVVENNYIGTHDQGTSASPNRTHGINIAGDGDNRIGGSQTASRNVISGNSLNGIRVQATGTNTVLGNYIGVGADGQIALGNSVNGLDVTMGETGVLIVGGVSAAERNIISSNGADGLTLNGGGNVFLRNNYVGVAADGTAARGNGGHGVSIATNYTGVATIGGPQPGERNIIANSGGWGITMDGAAAGAQSHIVQGNYLGLNAAGNAAGNGSGGINVNSIVAQTIGGNELGELNVIAANDGDGIQLAGQGNHQVTGNIIGAAPLSATSFPPPVSATAALRNSGAGIRVGLSAAGVVTIGGPTQFERNVIVNNAAQGIDIGGQGTVNVRNNLIGAALDAGGGYADMGNGADGVRISSAGANLIGGDDPAGANFADTDPTTTLHNVIAGNDGNGVSIVGSGNNLVAGNLIGTDPAVALALGNGATDSVFDDGDGNGIAITGTGSNTVRNNTIAGSADSGLFIFSTGTTTVNGNTIGRGSALGTAGLGNGGYGLFVPDRANGILNLGSQATRTGYVLFGGVAGSERNVISGNQRDGVRLEGNTANTLFLNWIGLDTAGTGAVGNGAMSPPPAGVTFAGVYLGGTTSTVNTLLDNAISGNSGYGVHLVSGANTLRRNLIGTDAAGTGDVGNSSHGVYLNDTNLPAQRRGQVIGVPDQGNTISGNGGAGIHLEQGGGDTAGTADDILIQGNRIGVDRNGLLAVGNDGAGIATGTDLRGKVWIGGLAQPQVEGNVIGGNLGFGINYTANFNTAPADNQPVIYGNLIGTNVRGDAALGNTSGGIRVAIAGGRSVILGDDGSNTGRNTAMLPFTNLIAGNAGDGIRVAQAVNVTVVGNFVGTDFFGRRALGNGGAGIAVDAAVTGNVYLGRSAGSDDAARLRNLVAGSGGFGIDVRAPGATNLIRHNLLGAQEISAAPGWQVFDTAGGNTGGGINVEGAGTYTVTDNVVFDSGGPGIRVAATGAVVGSTSLVQTGGAAVTDRNVVRRSGGAGILVASGNRNRLSANDLRDNAGLGIDLAPGANDNLAEPTLNAAVHNPDGSWTVTGQAIANAAAVEVYQAADEAPTTPDANPATHRGEVLQFLARLTQGSGLNANGTFTYTVPAGVVTQVAGQPVLFTALTIDSLANTSEFARNTGEVDAARATLVAVDPANGTPRTSLRADGTDAVLVIVTVTDAIGTPLPNIANVAVTASPSSGININQASTTTDANGQVRATVTASSRQTATLTLGARIGNAAIPATVTLNLDGATLAPTASVLTASPATGVVADGNDTSTFQIILREPVGSTTAPLRDVDPARIRIFEVNNQTGALTLTQPTQPTNQNGETTATVKSTAAGTFTFGLRLDGAVVTDANGQPVRTTVTFVAGGPANDRSTFEATPLVARPNGQEQITLRATVRDAFNNPAPGLLVSFSANPAAGVTIAAAQVQTDAQGVATTTATSTQPGTVQFSATAQQGNTAVLIGTADVTFRHIDPDAALSTLSIATDTPLLANGQRRATVTVRLRNPSNQPIEGVGPQEIQISATGLPAGAVTVTPPANATDANGETTFTVTSTQPGTVTIGVTARGVTLAQTVQATFASFFTHSYTPGLHLIGLAGTPDDDGEPQDEDNDPRSVFASLLPELHLARWRSEEQRYDVWTEFSPREPFVMLPGRGFWLELRQAATITVVGTEQPLVPVRIPLAQGWNQVANPYPRSYTFRLADIQVFQNGSLVGSLATEAGQALVAPYGWRWDPVLQYLLLIDPALAAPGNVNSTVEVGRGWWWLAKAAGVEVQLAPPAANRSAQRITRAAATPGSWLAALEAQTADGAAQALFGAGTSRFRAELPPPAPVDTPVTVEFRDSEGRAASDIRRGPLTTRQRWDVTVTSRQAGEVTLSWRGLNRALPANHRLWLVDPTNGRRVLMNSRGSYTYTGDAGARQMVVELDPRGERQLNITGLSVEAGRGRSAGVPLTLTLTAPAQVNVTVRGLGGRGVRAFTVEGVEGTNALGWDGKDDSGRPVPAGTYVIEVTAYTDEGEVARAVRTVAVR